MLQCSTVPSLWRLELGSVTTLTNSWWGSPFSQDWWGNTRVKEYSKILWRDSKVYQENCLRRRRKLWTSIYNSGELTCTDKEYIFYRSQLNDFNILVIVAVTLLWKWLFLDSEYSSWSWVCLLVAGWGTALQHSWSGSDQQSNLQEKIREIEIDDLISIESYLKHWWETLGTRRLGFNTALGEMKVSAGLLQAKCFASLEICSCDELLAWSSECLLVNERHKKVVQRLIECRVRANKNIY